MSLFFVILCWVVFFVCLFRAVAPKSFSAREYAWQWVAWLVSRERVRNWLINRAMRTPYSHLPGYMNRYWLFNAYEKRNGQEVTPIRWLPSIRVHHILRRDDDRHLHDHPWNARTILLKGWYTEQRMIGGPKFAHARITHARLRGQTAKLKFGEYHTITSVSEGGVWTLFITYGYKGMWGFLVDGKKVPWREYLGMKPDGPWAEEERTNEA